MNADPLTCSPLRATRYFSARLSTLAVFCGLLMGVCLTPTVWGQDQENQPRKIQRELDRLYDGIEINFSESPFLSPPRDALRPILKTKKLIERGEIKRAVAILGELLATDRKDDYLIPESARSYSSLRLRTEKILGWLGRENRKDYEFQYRIRAKKWLDEGLADNDVNKLKRVAEKYFFTPAGVEAVMVLGHLELSAGRPSIAVSWFQKVLRYPELASDYEPEASISLATCQLLSGNRQQADSTLASLKQRMPTAVVSLMGESRSIFAAGDDRINWLTSLIGDSPLAENVVVSKWLVSSGNVARTGKVAHGLPLIVPTWKQFIADTQPVHQQIRSDIQRRIKQGVSPASAVRPLVIGDVVLERSAERTFGVDINTGKRLWAYPPNVAWNRDSKNDYLNRRIAKFTARSYKNAIYGQASSDGRLAFLIPFPGDENSKSNRGNKFDAKSDGPLDWRTYNELVAIDCRRQGAVRWRVGGENGLDEPALEKAFFLGEPLPWEGHLYCACVLDSIIKLVVLDSRTGELKWSMELASTTREFPDLSTAGGITPSYADGKLFMTTGTGAIVAIDISNRSLVWGYIYKRHDVNQLIVLKGRTPNVLRDTWRDAQIAVAESKVLLTCRESLELICLDAESGVSSWRQGNEKVRVMRTENDVLYVAGIFQNQAILVGLNKARAIDLNTGQQNFVVDFSEYGVMSGRGYIGKDSLYLPASSNSVVRIDLVEATIAEAVFTGIMPGNIVRVGNKIISHGPDWLACFPELGESEKEIAAQRTDKLSPQQKLIQAQVLIQRGKRKEAFSIVESLADSDVKPQCFDLLSSCFQNYQNREPEIAFETLEVLGDLFPEQGKELRDKHWILTGLRSGKKVEVAHENLAQIEKLLDEPGIIFDPKESKKPENLIVVSAAFMDRLPIESRDDSTGRKGLLGPGEITYGKTGWHQALLNCSWKLLRESEPKAAQALRLRSEKLILDRLEDSESLEQALQLIPMPMLSTETLIKVSRARLQAGQLLGAFLMSGEASRREPLNGDIQLLRTTILVEGNLIEVAARALEEIPQDRLSKSSLESFQTLRKTVEKRQREKSRSPFCLGVQTAQHTWNNSIKSVVTDDESGDSVTRLMVVKCDDFTLYQRLRGLLTFDNKALKLHFSDANGITLNQLSKNHDLIRRRGSVPHGENNRRIDIVTISKQIANIGSYTSHCLFDCFRLNNGQPSFLWSGYGREKIDGIRCYVTSGRNISCFDTLTGRRIWSRKESDSLSGLLSDSLSGLLCNADGMISVLLDDASVGRSKLDGHTGRFTGTQKSNSEEFLDAYQDKQLVMQELENPAPSKQALEQNSTAKQAQTEVKLALLDFDENVLWEKDTTRQVQHASLHGRLFVLDRSGELEVIDLSTAEVVSRTLLKLEPRELSSITGIEVTAHSAGIILRVSVGQTGFSRFNHGRSSYQLIRYRDASATTGPILLLDSETLQPKWKNPARLSTVHLVPGQPFDAPCLVFARRVSRRELAEPQTYFDHLILLNAQTGQLVLNQSIPSRVSLSPRCTLERVQETDALKQYLVISSDLAEMKIELSPESWGAPAPPADLGLRASLPHRDIELPLRVGPLKDAQKTQLKNAALDAAERSQSELEQKALELKQKMGIR